MTSPIGKKGLVFVGGLFLLSGATALVYQILWVRVLSLTVGSTVTAISLVISAFMAGLALGSAWIGRRIDRSDRPLRVYAWLELWIGVCGVLVPLACRAIATASATGSGLVGWDGFPMVASFLTLLVPTTLMGGTLPVLSRFVAAMSRTRGGAIGWLYAINTLGAILGTFATGFVLIRVLGITRTSLMAAALNGLIFLLALRLAARPGARKAKAEPEASEEPPRGSASARTAGVSLITSVYAINGLVGLGLEVLWTRAIVLFTTNTIYAFTVILTTFLLGLTAGSTLMASRVDRLTHPARWLGLLQVGIGLLAAVTPIGIRVFGLPGGAAENATPLRQILEAYGVAAVFILPATLLMGASFPVVARLLTGELTRVGRRIGTAYALNTLGAVLGAFLATFLLLPAIGIQRAILVLAVLSSLSGIGLLVRIGARAWLPSALVPVAGALLLAFAPNQFRALLEEATHPLTFYREGVETTVSVFDSEVARRPVLMINNVALEDRGAVHKLLAHLPALIHPDPTRALVLGFGVGMSNQSFSTHGFAVNDCVEISPAVMEAAPEFAALNGNIADRGDPAFRAVIEDGRRFLLATEDPYDVIVLDANSGNLRNAGVGKLYTKDFFELCKDKLTDDGMATLYASPNGNLREFRMIVRTFLDVFPESSLWIDRVYGQTCVLIGARAPLAIDVDRYLSRLAKPAVTADLAVYDLDQPGTLLSCFVMGPDLLGVFTEGAIVNTDDRPVMEFFPIHVTGFELDDRPFGDNGFLLHHESVRPYLEGFDATRHAGLDEYLTRSEQTFPLLCDAWLHRWNGNMPYALSSTQMAASIHPDAEYLRGLLGYGQAALAVAEERVASAPSNPAVWDALGALSVRRGDGERALVALESAVEHTEPAGAASLGDVYVAAARAARGLGRLDLARDYLRRAGEAGAATAVESAELELAETRARGASPEAPLRRVVEVVLDPARLDLTRAYRAIRDLEALGVREVGFTTLAARYLESVGDMAGANVRYRDILGMAANDPGATAGAARTALELGLRRDVFTRAYGDDARARQPLSSPFEGRAALDVVRRNSREAEPWIELAGQYLRSGRPILAYRRARAARSVDPTSINAYVAIGSAAESAGSPDIARLAYERALELGGDVDQLSAALARVGASPS